MESYLNEDEASERWRTFKTKADVLDWLRRVSEVSTHLERMGDLMTLKHLDSVRNLMILKDEEGDEEGGGEKKDEGGGGGEKKDEGGGDKGGGGKGGGGGGSEKKDKPDDSEKKDKEGGGRAGEKKDKTSGELRKMGANKVYGGWFTFGPGTCAEAVVDEPKQEE